MTREYRLTAADWNKYKTPLSQIRREVFIDEQGVPEQLEWDEFDESSYHVLALDNSDRPIGCGRLKADGQIGRMAVCKAWRGKGVGAAILQNIVQHAKANQLTSLYLHAQTTAIPFYEKQAFSCCSDEFMEGGIAHKTMIKYI